MDAPTHVRTTRRFLCLLSFLTIGVDLAAQEARPLKLLWEGDSEFAHAPSDPLAFDVDLDGRMDLIQVGLRDVVEVLDPTHGAPIWRQQLGEDETLLSPVAGNFLGNDRITIVVPSTSGKLFILDGPTGRQEMPAQQTGFGLTLPPATFPLTGEDEIAPYREGILLYNPSERTLVGCQLRGPGHAQSLFELFRHPTQGILERGPSVGQTRFAGGRGPHFVYVTREGKVTVFNRAMPPAAITLNLVSTNRTYGLGQALGDLDGDGYDDIVIADSLGYLYGLTVRDDAIVPVWAPPAGGTEADAHRSIGSEPRFTPVTVDANADGKDDVLVVRDRALYMVDGASGEPFWESAALVGRLHERAIESPPAIFFDDSRTAYAVFCDVICMVVINLRSTETWGQYDLGSQVVNTPLVGPLTGGGAAQAFARADMSGRVHCVDLGLNFLQGSPAWMGRLGGPSRSGSANRAFYHDFRNRQQQRLSTFLTQILNHARTLAEAGQYDAALAEVRKVREISPPHREARQLERQYLIRANLIWMLTAGVLLLGLVGFVGFHLFRHTRAAIQQMLARMAIERRQYPRAIRLLRRLTATFPRRRRYVRDLADLYVQLKQFDAESALIFERAREMFPREDRYLKGLATAYSSIPRNDEAAARVYAEMSRVMKKPGPWFFLLGQTLMQIDRPREALEAFRQTIVHQHDDPKLPHYMTDLYIKLEIAAPEIIPTLDRVFEQRVEDRAFLRLYCMACQAARRYDERAQQVAEMLLELDPAAPPAHVILSTRLLQGGHNKDAMLHAQQILQVNPSDSMGLRLLGACYAAENRLDQTAMKIFIRALQANPDAPEILTAVSHGYAQEGRQDRDAREIYKKSLMHNPQDETVLVQLAQIAETEGDDDLTIRAIEPLLGLGRRTREMVLQLANAYCRQGIVEAKAEPIYREALVYQPDHATIQDNLAAIYLHKKKVDNEAAQVYAAVFERHPERFDIGLQLMRCHVAAEHPERALELGRRLQERDSDNGELQKLMAASSDRANQMDSAIQAYEQVLANSPEDPEPVCALSSLYFRKRRHDNEAIAIYNRAIQLQPQNHEHYMAAAQAYAARETWDHAIAIIKQLLTHVPTQIGAAIGLMEALIESSPKVLKLRWYLVDTLIFDGRLREARQHLTEIQRIDPGDPERALQAFDKILEKNPRDAMAHLERGRLLLLAGKEREARKALEDAHRFHPENEEVIRNLMKLYQKILESRDSAEVRFQLGRLAMRMDKYDLAISCFQQTSRDYRWEGESVRNLARCFMAKGMLDLALQELKRLPVEKDVKELLYELGQRYESVNDVAGAREVYKLIFAADITYRDVKGKLETLNEANADQMGAERTAIINSLSEKAKQRYELVEELGRGAMGIVYRAHDNELEEEVALKILPDSLLRNQEAVRRFRQEARNARRLAHPNIVRIHDIGEELGRKYISMEFVKGTDLKQKLRRVNRKLPLESTLRYMRQICEAMAYAHSIGIVHRDIKPANLMLDENENVKVTDFGIAKMVEQSEVGSTMAGAIIGTPLYMSPEQVKGQTVDHRADIYSMGIVFYELVNGHPPFMEGDLAYQHLFVEPKPLTNVSPELAEIIMKCLAKEKEKRWQSAEEMLRALDNLNGV